MKRRNREKTRRIRNLILTGSLTAIVLIVSTYAWFIGTQTVSVSSFDVKIAAADSLLLSTDGETWSSTINISKENLDTASYEDHTNSWGGEKGIFPISSVGELDSTVSRLKLYEKASLTPTTGGFRLLSSRVNNNGADGATSEEVDGYVVFDLFIKNFSGHQYIEDLNELDEEAIYLTTDSAVTVATSGVQNSGIENSARVAFAQIGRVSGTTTDKDVITGITCTDDSDNKVTGICRTAQIWEPNDQDHVDSAISWYNEACLKRSGQNVTLVASYDGGVCNTVANGSTYHTYAVPNAITSANNVDVYDGADYNGYTNTTIVPKCTGGTVPTTRTSCLAAYGVWDADNNSCSENNRAYCKAINGVYTETPGTCNLTEGVTAPTTKETCETKNGTWNADTSTCTGSQNYCDAMGGEYTRATGLLDAYPYFTDTMKDLTGTDRPEFITLAPNSITKVRIYIYIEGQDVDNYDFASVGKKIAVNFGFTKERFTDTDIDYTGPDREHTVTFDAANGKAGARTTKIVTTHTAVAEPTANPVKDGYKFDHWALVTTVEETETLTNYDFSTLVTDDILLRAIYTAQE